MTIVFLLLNTVLNSTLSSALPSGDVSQLIAAFDVSEEDLVLLTSIYLLGYVTGPLAFGPLSEVYGRRNILLPAFLAFIAFTLGCALAPNFPTLVLLRFMTGTVASAPITVVGGVYADIFNDPTTRGRAMALFLAVGIKALLIGLC